MNKLVLKLLMTLVLFIEVGFANISNYIAKIPGEYLSLDKNKFHMGMVSIEGQLIKEVRALSSDELKDLSKLENVIHLTREDKYLALYPGLIDLHNHPKQSLLPLWEHAHGQFANRHEWRDWSVYSHSLGGNMNPWSGNGVVEQAAAFRWSELQAVVLGTTLMQGPRFYTKNFSIGHVEVGDGFYNEEINSMGEFVAKELNVQTPTDLFVPDEMTYIYKDIGALKKSGMSFHDALEASLNKKCSGLVDAIRPLAKIENEKYQKSYNERLESYNKRPSFNKFHSLNVAKEKLNTPVLFTRAGINFLSEQDNREMYCGESRGDDFDIYFDKYHSSIVSKLSVLGNSSNSGIIAHLSEGRREDPFNQIEFDIAKTLDLIAPGMNLVHAVGLDKKDLKYIADRKVGVVWSPFSNLLLYGETLDVEEAVNQGINISLGSDWTPTGSKSVLEEVKIAKNYIVKNKLDDIVTDEMLFKMMAENPAKMIKKYEVDHQDGRHGVGTIKPDGMASLIAVSVENQNPYSNIVDASENEIALVISAGEIQYGDIELLKNFGVAENNMDWALTSYDNNFLISEEYEEITKLMNRPEVKAQTPTKLELLKNSKAFILKSIDDEELEIIEFEKQTELKLYKPSDIQKILHVLLTTQSRNAYYSKNDYLIEYLPPLISIADKDYLQRFNNFIKVDGKEDEVELNYVYRLEWRRELQDSKTTFNANNPHLPLRLTVPHRLANKYDLVYDIELGVTAY